MTNTTDAGGPACVTPGLNIEHFYQYLVAVWTANIFPIFREPGPIYSDSIRGCQIGNSCTVMGRSVSIPKMATAQLSGTGRSGGQTASAGHKKGGWATRKQGNNPPSLACYGGPGSVLPMGAPKCPNMTQYLDIFINISINICRLTCQHQT